MRSLRFANRPNVGRTWLFVGLVAAATLALTGSCRRNYPNRRARREQQAWPGLLEAMLRAKGYDVSVSVQGVIGDTSAGILQRLGSVAAGTIAGLLEPASWRRHHRATDSLRPARTGTAGRASQVVSPPHDWKF